MPKYNYVALDARGNETKGSLEVATQNEAIGRVKEMGLFRPKSPRPKKARKSRPAKRPGSAAKKRAARSTSKSKSPDSAAG